MAHPAGLRKSALAANGRSRQSSYPFVFTSSVLTPHARNVKHPISPCFGQQACHPARRPSILTASGSVLHNRWSHRLNCAASSTTTDVVTPTEDKLSVSLATREALQSIKFDVMPEGRGQAIVVVAVAEGSEADQAGVTPGLKLTGISDPVRDSEVWQLQDRPSLRFVRDAMRYRVNTNIQFEFITFDMPASVSAGGNILPPSSSTTTNDSATATDSSSTAISDESDVEASSSSSSSNQVVANAVDALVGGSGTQNTSNSNSSSNSSSPGKAATGMTIADRLAAQYEESQKVGPGLTEVQQRQQRRQDYMNAEGQRDDRGFLLFMLSLFVLPSLVILLVAYFSGYLDSMYQHSLTNLR
eukprot:jgi/Chrzof1/3360/Cz12g22090.t1